MGAHALWCAAAACGAFGAAYVALPAHAARRGTVTAWEALAAMPARLPALARVGERARRARVRTQCVRQMPAMLDVVTLGLSAGLSFDSSLELYCQRHHDPLAQELSAALSSWRLGVNDREGALTEAARRLDVASLERFASVVAQALAFGSPLAATLERQAQAIRDEQRAQLEEEIERVPVKMLIPLGTLIVPAMLLAILGPLLGASLSLG